jgi:hypothetical protein
MDKGMSNALAWCDYLGMLSEVAHAPGDVAKENLILTFKL